MKLILIFAQAITQQEQIIGFFYEAIYIFFFGVNIHFCIIIQLLQVEFLNH